MIALTLELVVSLVTNLVATIHADLNLWNVAKPLKLATKRCSVTGIAIKQICMVKNFSMSSHWSDRNKKSGLSLTDNFNRRHDYLRISVTERCNLRCLYCMPEDGVSLTPAPKILTSLEIYLLSSLFVSQGVTKIRLTGGEPTVRHDIIPLIRSLGTLKPKGLRELCLTTNGISLHRKLDSIVSAGVTGINISLDTLDPQKFQVITRRNGLEAVQKSINQVLTMKKKGSFVHLKINCVVIRGINDSEIISFVDLGRENDLEVRFIEYMPFDGNKWSQHKMLSFKEILDVIKLKYPTLMKMIDGENDTSKTYKVPGFTGRIGFITSITHNFCASCNRLRLTSDGNLKVCLFGNAEISLRDIIRKKNNGNPIDENTLTAFKQREVKDDQLCDDTSTTHGSILPEKELIDIIKEAVSKKKKKHAGIGELEKLTNRPMILIDKTQLNATRNFVTWLPFSTWKFDGKDLMARQFQRNLGRAFSSNSKPTNDLPHLKPSGSVQIVSISSKPITRRTATASCTVSFSNPKVIPLIRSNSLKKGDVLSVARIAGIMAAKKTSELIPLCHPVAITSLDITVETKLKKDSEKSSNKTKIQVGKDKSKHNIDFGSVEILVTVECDGKTGVEMEALSAAAIAGLTVYDMCKAVDREMRIDGLRIIRKEGGVSGTWIKDNSTQ